MDGLRVIREAHGAAPMGDDPAFYRSAVDRSLEFFEEEGIRATYFLIAEDLENPARKEAARRILGAGHHIGCHGLSHRYLDRIGTEQKRLEIVEGKERLEQELGVPCRGFRAPGYSLDFESLRMVRDAGYLYDSSVFPTERFRRRLGVHRLFEEPFAPWPGDRFFEVPLPDVGPGLPPFHPCYAFYLGLPYFRWASSRFAARSRHLTLLFHFTDFADRQWLGLSPRLNLYANNLFSGPSKIRFLSRLVDGLRRDFRFASVERVLEAWPSSVPELNPRTVLGISTTHETGACVVRDGRILSAVTEERLTREKLDARYPPEGSIREALRVAEVRPEEIDAVAIAGLHWRDLLGRLVESLRRDVREFHGFSDYVPHLCRVLYRFFYLFRATRYGRVLEYLRREHGVEPRVFHVEHHEAHAAAVYRTSGWDRGLVMTADGVGDELTVTLSVAEGSLLRRVHESWYPHSLGQFYTACTQILGFRGGRHEGKITGLAALGTPDPELLAAVDGTLYDRDGRFRLDKRYYAEGFLRPSARNLKALFGRRLEGPEVEYRNYKPALARLLRGRPPEDVARAYQEILEREAVALARRHWREELRNLGLAGGVFANVKLNMRMSEALDPEALFIFPAMGDGGLCAGAALSVSSGSPARLAHAYLGTSYSEDEIRSELESRSGVVWERPADAPAAAAHALAQGHIVARFDGGMEFGPRALGNRSILYHCGDRSVNDWLNRQLKRTEFMPFAPVCLFEDAERYFHVRPSELRPCEYMTLVVRCKPRMRELCPAAVHVDGTARPQLVRREVNPGLHDILVRYRELTGISCLINTSFNMHEEPIVRSPSEALDAFRQSRLDRLLLGPFLVRRSAETGREEFRETTAAVPSAGRAAAGG